MSRNSNQTSGGLDRFNNQNTVTQLSNLENVESKIGTFTTLTTEQVESNTGNFTTLNVENLSNLQNITAENANFTSLTLTNFNTTNFTTQTLNATSSISINGELICPSKHDPVQDSVSLGSTANRILNTLGTVAIGRNAGNLGQGTLSIAIGNGAGRSNQADRSVAIGNAAAEFDQKDSAVAIGRQAGQIGQKSSAVAIGAFAATNNQGGNSVAIGLNSGNSTQGDNSIAIGHYAGTSSQHARTIVLNASGSTTINSNRTDACFVNPVNTCSVSSTWPGLSNHSHILGLDTVYNQTTKELGSFPIIKKYYLRYPDYFVTSGNSTYLDFNFNPSFNFYTVRLIHWIFPVSGYGNPDWGASREHRITVRRNPNNFGTGGYHASANTIFDQAHNITLLGITIGVKGSGTSARLFIRSPWTSNLSTTYSQYFYLEVLGPESFLDTVESSSAFTEYTVPKPN
jgi:hypothetical protein